MVLTVLSGFEDIAHFEKVLEKPRKHQEKLEKVEIRYYHRLHSPGTSITWLLRLLGDEKGVVRS